MSLQPKTLHKPTAFLHDSHCCRSSPLKIFIEV
jgi:hypothetical protein